MRNRARVAVTDLARAAQTRPLALLILDFSLFRVH